MLISEGYRALQQELHKNERYGAASMKFADRVRELIQIHQPKTLLDYGAGKRLLRTAIEGVEITEYDPCVPEISARPEGVFDMVCCLDVLEHIEPECLDDVLADIAERTGTVALMTIHTGPAGKFMSDGRNAHLIQRPVAWWHSILSGYFRVVETSFDSATTAVSVCEKT
jgi:hypothetical protein